MKQYQSNKSTLTGFIIESNRIEVITVDPSVREIDGYKAFLKHYELKVGDVCQLVQAIQPGTRLRMEPGMDVQVGAHTPRRGGNLVLMQFKDLMNRDITISHPWEHAWELHLESENLHPFMDCNGRSGRAVWLWLMAGAAPLGFLHHFYYQTLHNARAK